METVGSQAVGAAPSPGASNSPQGAPAGQPPSPSASTPQIDPQEFAAYKRQAEQARGYQPFFERATKLGFRRPEELDDFAPLIEAARGFKQFSPAQLARILKGEEEQSQGTTPQQSFDPVEFERKQEEKLGRMLAARERDSKIAEQRERFSEKKLAELLKDVPEKVRPYIASGIQHKLLSSFGKYPDDHPLRGEFSPAEQSALEALEAELKELPTHFKASALAHLGDAAGKSPAPPAVDKGGNGKPQQAPRRAGGLPSREEVEEAARKLAARRAATRA